MADLPAMPQECGFPAANNCTLGIVDPGGHSISERPVIAQSGNLVLATQFANALHVIDEAIFAYSTNLQRKQNISGNEVVVINILDAHMLIH